MEYCSISSGCVVGTMSTAICAPFRASKSARRVSSCDCSAADSVPRQVGHARGQRRDRLQRREQQRRRDQDGESRREMPDHGLVSNSTVGGFEISASFSTVKFGFTS